MVCGIDSVYTSLSLPTVAPSDLAYVNQSTLTVSAVINHHQQLCEQNSYMTGGNSLQPL
jgi:hypothetical protein